MSNDGPPIPPESLPRLFRKFEQLLRPKDSGYQGTGLGLALCKEILALHGSAPRVESGPETGTVFRFDLREAPLAAPGAAEAGEEVDHAH